MAEQDVRRLPLGEPRAALGRYERRFDEPAFLVVDGACGGSRRGRRGPGPRGENERRSSSSR
jgi:hypothetical protein